MIKIHKQQNWKYFLPKLTEVLFETFHQKVTDFNKQIQIVS